MKSDARGDGEGEEEVAREREGNESCEVGGKASLRDADLDKVIL